MQDDNEFDGVWLVAEETDGKGHIGRYCADNGQGAAFDRQDAVVELVNAGGLIPLKPAYEMIILVGPTPGGGIGKQVASTPVGLCAHECRVYVRASSNLKFLADMHRDDQEKYRGLIEHARKSMDTGRLRDAGIVLAGPGSMPSPVKTR